MPFNHLETIGIAGLAACVPLDGRRAPAVQTASDLGFIAAGRVLDKGNVGRRHVGAVVYAGMTPDYRSPATACVLQHRLGLSRDCVAYDMNIGGAGFGYGLQAVGSLLAGLSARYALLVLGDTPSKQIPASDSDAEVYCDAGSAVLLERHADAAPMDIHTRAVSDKYTCMMMPGGGFRGETPMTDPEAVFTLGERHRLRHHWSVLRATVQCELPALIEEFMRGRNMGPEAYDRVIITPADDDLWDTLPSDLRARTISGGADGAAHALGSAIPLTLAREYGASNASSPQRLMAAGFGEGLSFFAMEFCVRPADVEPVIESDAAYDQGAVSHEF